MLERVMIIAGESSGELYGSLLAGCLRELHENVRIEGIGGEKMAHAGVHLIATVTGAFGLSEALRSFRELRASYRKVVAALAVFRPQVIILIDFPDFNFRVADAARKRNIPVLYYVSPQIWAWRSGRIRTLARLVNRMAVILPFEEEIYRHAGVPCEFVGHPILDDIRTTIAGEGAGIESAGTSELRNTMKKSLGLDPERPVMAFLPGSRPHEVERLLPALREAALTLKGKHPGMQMVIPAAPNLGMEFFREAGRNPDEGGVFRIVRGNAVKVLASAESAVIASGTSTLQAALLQVPSVVVYKLAPLTYFLAKRILRVRHIALVNLLIDKTLGHHDGPFLTELIQKEAEPASIVREAERILSDSEYRAAILGFCREIFLIYRDKHASRRVAEMASEIAGQG